MSLSGTFTRCDLTALANTHLLILLPRLVILPCITLSAELRTDGTIPAYEHSFSGLENQVMFQISAAIVSAVYSLTPGIVSNNCAYLDSFTLACILISAARISSIHTSRCFR